MKKYLLSIALALAVAGQAWAAGSMVVPSQSFRHDAAGAVARTAADKLKDEVSAADFGAVGVGDETSELQAAIDSLGNGGVVWLGNGKTYDFSALVINAGVELRGKGPYGAVLRSDRIAGNLIELETSAALLDVKVVTSVTKTSGAHVEIKGNGARVKAELEGYYVGVSAGVVGGVQVVNPVVDVVLRNPVIASGAGGVQFMNFSNARATILATGPDSGTQPDFGVRFRNGDTAFVTATNITKHGKALLVDPEAGSNCYALRISDSLFDSAGTITGGNSVSSAEFVPAGGVWDTQISNTWFGLSGSRSGAYLAPSGAGVVDGWSCVGCIFPDNGDSGLLVVGAGVKNWVVTGGYSSGNVDAGIRAATGTTDFAIAGHKAGDIGGRGANNYGIKVDAAASDNYQMAGNVVVGNVAAGILDQGTGVNARVVDNLGYNGAESVSGVTVGASPWSYTAGHTPETIYIAGGAVSAIAVDGQIVQNATASTIQLLPNQVMSITYSSLPTVMRKKN